MDRPWRGTVFQFLFAEIDRPEIPAPSGDFLETERADSSENPHMDEPLFAVATFERVFDVEPLRDVITLEQLAQGLRRFVVKNKTRQQLERSERRIEAAFQGYASGQAAGAIAGDLRRVAAAAEAGGRDPRAAAEEHYRHLLAEARSAPKRDLRLWSPALYPAEARRSGDNVVHLSCLVLDYDGGTPPGAASATWADYFHLIHSTFSYTPERLKFRLILPLAEPVAAADWPRVYEWAQARTNFAVDPTGKGVGSTFALPAVPEASAPRLAFSRPGPLLDARLEGLIARAAAPPPMLRAELPNHFRIPIPGHEMVEGSWPENTQFPVADGFEDDDWQGAFPWDR